jgi:flagellar biosynthesis protein FlhB
VSDGRTEQATPKRRREARRKGEVARSAELSQGIGLAVSVLLLPTVVSRLSTSIANDWEAAAGVAGNADPGQAAALMGRFFAHAALAFAPLLGALALGGIAGSLVMTGGSVNFAHLKPKWSYLNPGKGIKKLASKQILWELLKVTGKLALLTLVTYGVWQAGVQRLLSGPSSLQRLVGTVGWAGGQLLVRVAMLAALIGVVDAVVSKRRHMKQLRMTKQEVKDEHKQTDGNPIIKGAIRAKQMKMSRLRMMAEISRADVVLTNPTHYAVAIAYDQKTIAPVVVAKGAGVVAQKIREEARRHGVPIRENKPLARALFRSVEIGDPIPVNLYRAVAEVLAAIYRARRPIRSAA